ncbi:MAG: class I SAM-dependent RNA methyltransferase [Marinosulfonomonas sp.]
MKLTIERLGHQGDGVARGPVFVAKTLPGELVEGEILGDRIDTPKILESSSDRVTPPCRHFKACGGCSLQHASDEFVSDWKADVVRTALSAHGIDAPIKDVHTSPERSRRRAALSGRRTKKGAIVGFHARASGEIIEIPDCQLLLPELMAVIPALQELTVAGASRKAELSFTITHSLAGVDVVVLGGKELDGPLRSELAMFCERYGFARLIWGDEPLAERAPPSQPFGSAKVVPPAGAFLQATQHGEASLLAAVQRCVEGANQIADLFSGCGTFSLPLAAQAEMHCVETDAAMLAALDQGWRSAKGLKKMSTEARDLFRRPLMPDELKPFDAVVLDPPRAGANAQSMELAKSSVPRIAAVSCNPVTFARDAQVLIGGGYSLDWIEVVDQFRWSPHVELVASFTKA